MGWWNATREGTSLIVGDTGYVWGDGPADILDNALMEIRSAFLDAEGRNPTLGELRAGLEFSLCKGEDTDEYGDNF